MKYIPYGHQDINSDDIQAVIDVLQSDFITQGAAGVLFEKAVAKYCNVQYGVAVNSATSALHIACKALGLSRGDYLWTSPNTFVASANCGLYCGAKVDFVDIDPITYNMDVDALRFKLERSERKGTLPKIVIPVHFAGQSCPMQELALLSQKYGFSVIEDASHAVGADYCGEKVGSCSYSDMTIFSFHPVKIITTGEGGMVLTRREELYEKLMLLRSHGITRDPQQLTKKNPEPWFYQQIDLGYNLRMTDIQAALGYSQLKRLDDFIAQRRRIANRYSRYFRKSVLVLPRESDNVSSAWHLYVVRLCGNLVEHRKEIVERLHSLGIGVNVHYIPVHLQPYYRKFGFTEGDFPEAEKHYLEAISVPLYHGMSRSDQDRVMMSMSNVLETVVNKS